MAMDFEANTADPYIAELDVRCVSFANDNHVVSIDLHAGGTEQEFAEFREWLVNQQMIAHNTKYDFGVIYAKTGKLVMPYADTFGAFGHLANDERRSWGLKAAQVDILGWDVRGDKEFNEYKRSNNLDWSDIDKFDFSILGKYNCYDTDSTWQLFKHMEYVVATYSDTWGQYFWEAHREDYLTEVLLQIEAQFEGIPVDVVNLTKFGAELDGRIYSSKAKFLEHQDIKPHIDEYNRSVIEKEEGKNKPQFTKSGDISKNWIKWQPKLELVRNTFHFNMNSPAQLKWLFFNKMKIEPTQFSETTGEPSTSKKALKELGVYGGMLLTYRDYVTIRGFVTQLINVEMDGIFHPNVVLPSTVTGRAASKELIK